MVDIIGENTIKANIVGGGTPISANIVNTNSTINATPTTFGYATTTKAGIIRIATDNEADTGTATNIAITPHTLSNGLNTKQDIINDLSIIRSNATDGYNAYNTILEYGDIVSYNASDFATSIQGSLADTALQPNDNISELVNDSGYITSAALPTKLSDLTDDLGANPIHTHSQYLTEHQDISGKADIEDLSEVAFSGDYEDLTNLPTIGNAEIEIQKNNVKTGSFTTNQSGNKKIINIDVPTKVSDLTNDTGYITGVSWNEVTNKPTTFTPSYHEHVSSEITDLSTTIASAITNKADRATSLSGYGITDAYTKTEIDGMVSAGMHYKGTKSSVSQLPSSGNQVGDLWNVDDTGANYAWNGTSWDKLSENIDLSGYVPTSRTINGKSLSGDISLTASDVGALPNSTIIPTVDQIYDSTSGNAQSGVAINGAGFLRNTATGNSSITVNGTATTKSQAINIGTGSQATGNYGTALGAYSFGNASHALGIGNYAKATADYAIQLNKGTNNTSNSLCVGFNSDNYQLLDGTTGLIPDARISTNIARTTDIPTATSDLTNDSGYITNSAIGNGTITITQGGVTKGTFSTNQSGNTTIALDAGGGSGTVTDVQVNGTSVLSGGVASITVPTATSDLTNDSGFITSSDLPTNHVTTDTDQNITGTKTFVGQKKIAFKQSGTSDKLGFTLYNNSGTEKGYLEYNPSNTVDNVPLMTLGNYATASGGLTHVGFRKYSGIGGKNGAYNLLTPLISDARTPFNLTTTYTNFYLPLGFTDGTTTVKTAKSGLVDLSSILPTVNNSTITFTQGGVTKGTITLNQSSNGTIALDAGGSGGIQNTATATDSLTIEGVANDTYQNSINIGTSSISNGDFSVSIGSTAGSGIVAGNYSVSIGSESTNTYETTTGDYSVAIGVGAVVEDNSIAIGYEATSTGANNILIGKEAGMDEWADNSIAIGYGASVSGEIQYGETGNNIINSIQLGAGTNEVSGTLQVWNHQLLNKTTGLIPDARLSSNIARISDIPTTSGIFIATYGTTTYAKVEFEFESGKIIYCKRNYIIYSLAYKSAIDSSFIFVSLGEDNVNRYATLSASSVWAFGSESLSNIDLNNLSNTGQNLVNTTLDQNSNTRLKYWTGTQAEYDAILTKDNNTIYNVEDTISPIISILDSLYPIGAIYVGTMSTCPLATLGIGNWQLVAQDRVLQGAGTRGTVGTTVNESLPNIVGNFKIAGGGGGVDGFSGVFYSANSGTSYPTSQSGTAGNMAGFDASRISATYKNNAPVQQNAYLVNIWERVS